MSQGTEIEVDGVKYRKSDKKTDEGAVIWHKVTGLRGRPAQFVRKQGAMVPLNA